MITMDEFSVYRFYLALKLHFTTDNYDVIKQQGKVRATKKSLYKRKDIGFIKRIATTYNDEEVVNFLIANFVSGDRWGGLFDQQAKETYLLWKKRIESLTYTFTKETEQCFQYAEDNGISSNQFLFGVRDGFYISNNSQDAIRSRGFNLSTCAWCYHLTNSKWIKSFGIC